MFELHNKVALVTGGRQGMGKADALLLAKQGAKVVVTDVELEGCQMVVNEIIAGGGEAVAFVMDVANKAEVEAVFDAVIEKYGRLDILVNNAGIYHSTAALELGEEEWSKLININLKGQFFCAQRAAKEMAKNGWGRIINIASIASGQTGVGIAGGLHYTASKGGVVAMTETMAIEFAPLGVNVNCIAPGAIDTPMAHAADMPKEAMAGLIGRLPLKRMGTPEEIAAAVLFLASEEASYITGALLHVDGGWLTT